MDTITPQQNFINSRLTFVNSNLSSNRTRPYNINCFVKAFLAQQQNGLNNNVNQRQHNNNNNGNIGNNYNTSTVIRNVTDNTNNIINNSSVQGTVVPSPTPALLRNLNILSNIYNQKNDGINNNNNNNNVGGINLRQQLQPQQPLNILIGGIHNGLVVNNNINNNINNNGNINNNNDDNNKNENGPLLSERYLILKQLPGSSFYNCMDIKTGESLICKAIGNSYQKILNAYFRMDNFEHIKPLHKLLQTSTDETYLLLPPSQYGDLHSFVRERKRLREPEARYLFRQICKTVKECHQQGIVLRDLKLRKFVFSDKERTHLKFESLEDAVVLDDYDNDILKEKIGCPAYVAPEILKPNSDFSGKAADLWSLGVILYTMLVGRYPFNDPEHSSLFAKIARCTFIIPDFVSPKARCLIKSLLQKVPKNRLTSDDLLDHQWLQQDTMITIIGGGYNSVNNNIGSFALASATNNYELSLDDQRVPDVELVEFT